VSLAVSLLGKPTQMAILKNDETLPGTIVAPQWRSVHFFVAPFFRETSATTVALSQVTAELHKGAFCSIKAGSELGFASTNCLIALRVCAIWSR
jgi:hypothetical protein